MNDDPGHPFAVWGTLACLVLGLALFVTATAPALGEREELRSVRADLEHDLRQYRSLLRAFESRGLGAVTRGAEEHDLQALLVAIDAMGHTPAELLALYPEGEGANGVRGR